MIRGHDISFAGGQWVFADNGLPTVSTWKERPCFHCDQHQTTEGHDACLGELPGLMNACCGHGHKKDAYVQFLSGISISGERAVMILDKIRNFNSGVGPI